MSPEVSDLWIVVGFIQEFRLDAVTRALAQLRGFGGMTVSDCRGFGRGKLVRDSDVAAREERGERSRASGTAESLTDFAPKVRVEAMVAGEAAAREVFEALAHAAHTGRPGDGKVVMWPVADAVRVRTGERGGAAL